MPSLISANADSAVNALTRVVEEVGNLDFLGWLQDTGRQNLIDLRTARTSLSEPASADLDTAIDLLEDLRKWVGNYPRMEALEATIAGIDAAIVGFDAALAAHLDTDASAWSSAVQLAGGLVPGARLALISEMIFQMKFYGMWALTYDCSFFGGTEITQALISLKQRTIATNFGATLVANIGLAGNGSNQYVDLGWIPGAPVTMDNCRLAVLVSQNGTGNPFAIGAERTGQAGYGTFMRPASSSFVQLNSSGMSPTSGSGRSPLGRYVAASRNTTRTTLLPAEGFFDGGYWALNATATRAGGPVTASFFLLSMRQSAGTPATPTYTATIGWADVGAQFTRQQEEQMAYLVQNLRASALGVSLFELMALDEAARMGAPAPLPAPEPEPEPEPA